MSPILMSKSTVAGTCRRLITAGRTNKVVAAHLSRRFNKETREAKYIASWYRAECKRRGLLKD